MEVLESKNEAKGSQEEFFGILCKISAKAQNYYFSIVCNCYFKFRGSMLEGRIGLGVSWRALGASWRRLKASWRPLGASYGDLASQGVLEAFGGGFEASRSAPGGEGPTAGPENQPR